MFRIDTGQARTDLYGIGKGAAQVIDLSPTQRRQEQEASQNFAAQQQKEKEQAAKDADIENNISKLNAMKIMPRDQQLAADKLAAVREYVVKNNGMRDATPAQQMEFQKLIGDAKVFSDLSQNHREALETRGLEIMKNPDQYRPEAIDYYRNQFASDNAGNFDLDDSQFKQKFDYYGHVIKNLLPTAKSQADAAQTPYSEKFSLDQAKGMIANDISSNPTVADEALYQFNKAEDKLGAKTASEYMQNKYANDLVVNMRKAGPQVDGGGTKSKLPNVSGTYTNQGNGKREFQFEYIDKVDNPYISIPNPNKKGESIEVKPYKVVFGGETPVLRALSKPKDGEKGEEVTLDYNSVSDIMNNKFGIENVYSLEKAETTPGNVKVKRQDIASDKKVNEVKRKTKDGKIAIFNADTKEFIRYE